jgi:hypothetical protein
MNKAMLGLMLIAWTAGSAHAFVCTRTPANGPSLAWGTREVDVYVANSTLDVTSDAQAIALSRAANEWQTDCTDMQLRIAGVARSEVVGFDWQAGSGASPNENIVVYRNAEPEDDVDAWLYQLGALAITTVTYVTTTGELLDADVEVNDASMALSACDPSETCVVRVDLQNMMTHEFGHVLGLDHPPGNLATMAATSSQGDLEKRTLSDDDVAGICTLYPSGSLPGECYDVPRQNPPPIVVRSGCATQPPVALWCMALALLWRRRRHAHKTSTA